MGTSVKTFFSALLLLVALLYVVNADDTPLIYKVSVDRAMLSDGTHTFAFRNTIPATESPKAAAAPTHVTASRFALAAEFIVERSSIVALHILFSPDTASRSYAFPPFVIKNSDHSAKATRSTIQNFLLQNDFSQPPLYPAANARRTEIPIREAFVSELPDIFELELRVPQRAITSFSHTLASLSEIGSGQWFDARSLRSWMNFRFEIRRNPGSGMIEVRAMRRPPIPDCTLLVFVEDGGRVVADTFHRVPPRGVETKIQSPVHTNSSVTFVAHFYEVPRKLTAEAKISSETANRIADEFDAQQKAASGSSSQMQSAPQRFAEVIESSVPQTRFELQYFPETFCFALKLLQPHPLEGLRVSIFDSNEELLFREDEAQVPFFTHTSESQFGWFYALPAFRLVAVGDTRQVSKEYTSESLRKVRRIVADYNARPVVHPVTLMSEWIKDEGGDVSLIDVSAAVDQAFASQISTHKAPKSPHIHIRGLRAKQRIDETGVVARLPYQVLLSSQIVLKDAWCSQLIARHADEYLRMSRSVMFHSDGIFYMALAYLSLSQPTLREDGKDWRIYLDTLPTERPPLPLFFADSERSYFSFLPSISRTCERINQMWQFEYSLLTKSAAWFGEKFSKEKYFVTRAHVESRVVNVSGVLLMMPLMDYMDHDDDPNLQMTYDDRDQEIVFRALRNIKIGGSLTVDYGSSVLTKKEFFLQFGIVPPGALDSAEVVGPGGAHFELTYDLRSRKALLTALKLEFSKSATAADGDDGMGDEGREDSAGSLSFLSDDPTLQKSFSDLLLQRINQLPRAITEKSQTSESENDGIAHMLPRKHQSLIRMANRLLRSEKEVLDRHLKWANEEA